MTRTETPQRNSSRPSSEFGQAYFLNTGAGGAGVADGSAQLGLPVQEGARLSDCSVERRLRPATASRKKRRLNRASGFSLRPASRYGRVGRPRARKKAN